MEHGRAAQSNNRRLRAGLLSIVTALLLLLPGLLCPAAAWQEQETVRVGVYSYPGYAYRDTNGIWAGVDIEYMENIAQHSGFRVEFVPENSTEEILEDLQNGAIDMAANMSQTPQRKEQFLFSEQAQGSSSASLVMRQDDDRCAFGDVSELMMLRCAGEQVSNATKQYRQWCQRHGFTPNVVEYPSAAAVLQAVSRQEVDAGIVGDDYAEGFRTVQTFGMTSYYFMFRKEETALKDMVDEAMTQILTQNPLYIQNLEEKYNGSHKNGVAAFSKAEQTYIAQNPTVTVAVLKNDAPYFFEEKGKAPSGILPELYTQLEALTGLQFVFQTYGTNEEALTAVQSGRADVLGMYSDGLTYAYASGLLLTRPYTTVNTVMITRAETDSSEVKTLAVKERSREAIMQNTAQVQGKALEGYDTAAACFEALTKREVDGMICGLPSATWLINQTNSTAYRIQPLSSVSLELCGGVAGGNTALRSILDKGIYASAYSMSGIVAGNTLPENNWKTVISRIPPAWTVLIAAVMLALVLILVCALLALNRRQKERAALAAQRMENERRENELAAMEKSSREKNQFFSNISHDMRTPLNAILGFAQLCRRESDPARLEEYHGKILSSGKLLLELIDDTLTVSKMGSGKLELHPEPVAERDLFDAIVSPIRAAADKQGLHFSARCTTPPERVVLADRLNVEKIMLNLLSNAVKYTPEGGHVEFVLEEEAEDPEGRETVLLVRDDGIGMSREFLPHLYEPFAQEQQTGYGTTGTGLGLSIVKNLVELMDGTISVVSEKGRGTTFTVRLHFPPVRQACAPAAETAPEQPVDFSGKKLLLCEDNPLNREIACAILGEKGIVVDTAQDGQEGVERFTANPPGTYFAILMDIRMPRLDGYGAARAIRALPRADAAHIPILAMTADAFEEDVRKAEAAGMNAHLAKPIDGEKLCGILAQWVEPSAPQQ